MNIPKCAHCGEEIDRHGEEIRLRVHISMLGRGRVDPISPEHIPPVDFCSFKCFAEYAVQLEKEKIQEEIIRREVLDNLKRHGWPIPSYP